MELHVLNGDALKEKFLSNEKSVVCRECLIDGPVDFDTEADFWKGRAAFIESQFGSISGEYEELVVHEIQKLKNPQLKKINLWFELDLFCQINLWFIISYIKDHSASTDLKLFLISPDANAENVWSGFGKLTRNDLFNLYKTKVDISAEDQSLAIQLWNAYRKSDMKMLSALSEIKSRAFPKLKEVCTAETERHVSRGLNRPQRKLKSILDSGIKDFNLIFETFQRAEGVYGFGDTQVKRLLEGL